MKKTFFLAASFVLVAGAALASNTGFKLNYPLNFTTGLSNNNLVSFPTFWYPNGQVGQPQTSQDACLDFNNNTPKDASRVAAVVRFDALADAPKTKSCLNTISAFGIVSGESYALIPAKAGVVVDIVGSNDDNMSPNKGGTASYPLQFTTGLSNNNWASVPYHSKADTSQDLCVELNNNTPKDASNVAAVVRFDSLADAPKTKSCLNTISAFNLTPGEGYIFVPAAAGKNVAFNVY